MGAFAHRSLRVYAATLDLYEDALRVTRGSVLTAQSLEGQLLRAIASVALNIAEGAAEFSPGEKVRFYRIARRSAAEAGAGFDLLARQGKLTLREADAGNRKLEAIAAMLTSMIHQARQASTLGPAVRSGPAPRPTRSINQKPAPETIPEQP
ncbi:MAG: four helix bundle protein [Longimicrobiales bacterium]